MGMDLIAVAPRTPDAERGFHVNWSGWRVLADLLLELGCSTDEISGSNDGNRVEGDTAAAWATAIEDSLARIQIEEIPDPSYAGGVAVRLRVPGTTTPAPEYDPDAERALINQIRARHGRPLLEASLPEPTRTMALTEDEEQLSWVRSFAQFCRDSGGFDQF